MNPIEPRTMLGLGLSGAVLLLIGLAAWWLYRSHVPALHFKDLPPFRHGLALAAIVTASAAVSFYAAFWDTGMHLRTGTVLAAKDFLWPPHLLLYAGFLVDLVVIIGIAALSIRQTGGLDPRPWVRANPEVGAIGLFAGYVLAAIPGDAIWHELFGIDLTAWSPPHLLLIVGSAVTLLAAAMLARRQRADWRRDVVLVASLALALNEFLILVFEWELPRAMLLSEATLDGRPGWLYPALTGALVYGVLLFAHQMRPHPGMISMVALAAWLIRIADQALVAATGEVPVGDPLPFLAAAVLLDAFLSWRFTSDPKAHSVIAAFVFFVAFLPLAVLQAFQDGRVPVDAGDAAMASLALGGAILVLRGGLAHLDERRPLRGAASRVTAAWLHV